jgi:hypothetical protein
VREYTSREAADHLGVSVQHWHRLVDRYGITPCRQAPGLRGARWWWDTDVDLIRQDLEPCTP